MKALLSVVMVSSLTGVGNIVDFFSEVGDLPAFSVKESLGMN